MYSVVSRSLPKQMVRSCRPYSVAAYNEKLRNATADQNVKDILTEMEKSSVEPTLETYKLVMNFYKKNWEVNGKAIEAEEDRIANQKLKVLYEEIKRDEGKEIESGLPSEK